MLLAGSGPRAVCWGLWLHSPSWEAWGTHLVGWWSRPDQLHRTAGTMLCGCWRNMPGPREAAEKGPEEAVPGDGLRTGARPPFLFM